MAELAARGVKRVTLELGGSDPMIVLDDADVDGAVSAASVGRFFNCGQACLAVKRLYVHERVVDEFVEKLRAKVAKLGSAPGTADGTILGPLHSESQRDALEEQVSDDALRRRRAARRRQAARRRRSSPRGWFYEPTLIREPPHDSRVAVEEVFGPALPIWEVRVAGRGDRAGQRFAVRSRLVDLDA